MNETSHYILFAILKRTWDWLRRLVTYVVKVWSTEPQSGPIRVTHDSWFLLLTHYTVAGIPCVYCHVAMESLLWDHHMHTPKAWQGHMYSTVVEHAVMGEKIPFCVHSIPCLQCAYKCNRWYCHASMFPTQQLPQNMHINHSYIPLQCCVMAERCQHAQVNYSKRAQHVLWHG